MLDPEAQNEKMLGIYRPILSKMPVDLFGDRPDLAGRYVYICSELPIQSKELLEKEGVTHVAN